MDVGSIARAMAPLIGDAGDVVSSSILKWQAPAAATGHLVILDDRSDAADWGYGGAVVIDFADEMAAKDFQDSVAGEALQAEGVFTGATVLRMANHVAIVLPGLPEGTANEYLMAFRAVVGDNVIALPTPEVVAPRTDLYALSCYDWLAEDDGELTYESLSDLFDARDNGQDAEDCEASLKTPGEFVPTGLALKALDSYKSTHAKHPDDATIYRRLVELCAAEDLLDGYESASTLRAVLILCPRVPGAKRIALLADKSYIPDDGTYYVGEEIKPGLWKTYGSAYDCYWERSSGGGSIIANNFITSARDGATVSIGSGDGSFTTEGCGEWRRVD